MDPNLYYNLQTTLALEYPHDRFEVIFTVQDENDPAVRVVEMLLDEREGGETDPTGKKRWEHVDAKWMVSTEVVGTNPKINNLMRPFKEAKYEVIWVVDATISVARSMLARSVEALYQDPTRREQEWTALPSHSSPTSGSSASLSKYQEQQQPLLDETSEEASPSPLHDPHRIGLVHHVPYAWVPNTTTAGTFGSQLESCYLNSVHARMYLAINATGLDSCVVGKSCLYRKSDIARISPPGKSTSTQSNDHSNDRATGLATFGPYLPEDNLIAHSIMHQLKLGHAMTPDLAMDCLGSLGVSEYVARRVRWIRVRLRMVLAATLIEPLTESLLLGWVTSWALHTLFDIPRVPFFVIHQLVWFFMDLGVLTSLQGGELPRGKDLWNWIVVWSAREVLALPVWIKAVFGGSVVMWRGVKYRIESDGRAVKAE